MVIAQCYQMGPATKIDPLMMIADAKRVCDNLVRSFYRRFEYVLILP